MIEKIYKEVDEVMQNAKTAFDSYRKITGKERAAFLQKMADLIEANRETLVPLAIAESHLPLPRLNGELSRTTNQLRMFARLIAEGSWVFASVDTADTARVPAKPDVRKMFMAVGPVVVFGASNFPFAFSTAGGDSASVLASGSTLVVKGHPAHPKTSAAMFEVMQQAVAETNMPENTVQHITGDAFELGKALVVHPITTGVGFTGSYKGGIALMNYAKERKNPIPVFTEMGSINPVVFYPQALKENNVAWAKAYAASITLGSGQFCTNPGLLLAIQGEGLETFIETLSDEIKKAAPQTMLHEGICAAYFSGLKTMQEQGIEIIGQSETVNAEMQGYPTVAKVAGKQFLQNPTLHQEVFGPYSLLVVCDDKAELTSILQGLEGQLTSSIIATPEDMEANQDMIDLQISLAGRILVNDVPTGVDVCASMVHGGPFPATSDGRYTSVGTMAINRWVRPVCFQGFPQAFLPDELKDENPLGIWRVYNTEMGKK